MLNRSDKTIWAAYHQARKKMRERLTVQAGYSIPIKPIADRKQAVLQAVITHLKEHYEMEYAQIAKLLHRKYSTIAGTYRRHR
jgi:DNA-directed RNA polymerase specialized sigma24 family protein